MLGLLVVMINAAPGRQEEFNDWYTNVHIRDVMRFAGSTRVQRLELADLQVDTPTHDYLTIYDTFDADLLSREHRDAMGTRRMVVTHVHDQASVINSYFYTVAMRSIRPAETMPDDRPLIIEQLNVPADDRDAFEAWYAETRLSERVKAPSHVSGALLRFEQAGQMFAFEPTLSHVALWRVDDLAAALRSWREDILPQRFAGVRRTVAAYRPMAPYLTRDQVMLAPAEELAIEEAARLRAEAGGEATTEELGVTWR